MLVGVTMKTGEGEKMLGDAGDSLFAREDEYEMTLDLHHHVSQQTLGGGGSLEIPLIAREKKLSNAACSDLSNASCNSLNMFVDLWGADGQENHQKPGTVNLSWEQPHQELEHGQAKRPREDDEEVGMMSNNNAPNKRAHIEMLENHDLANYVGRIGPPSIHSTSNFTVAHPTSTNNGSGPRLDLTIQVRPAKLTNYPSENSDASLGGDKSPQKWEEWEERMLMHIVYCFVMSDLKDISAIAHMCGIKRTVRAVDKKLKRMLKFEKWRDRDVQDLHKRIVCILKKSKWTNLEREEYETFEACRRHVESQTRVQSYRPLYKSFDET